MTAPRPRLWLVPLEPMEERYTGAWFRWLPETFSRAFEVQVIDGTPLSQGITTGAFLDLFSSAHYKATQLAQIAALFAAGDVRPGDAFFVSDIEYPGIEQIRYLSRLGGVPVRLFGFLHAGSYTRGDFMEPMEDVGRMAELAWVLACDRVYVGSQYHCQAFLRRRASPGGVRGEVERRLVVTGNPWRTDEARTIVDTAEGANAASVPRDIDILFPHRPDAEKGLGDMLRVLPDLLKRGLRVAFTTGRATYRSTNAPELAREVEERAARGEVMLVTGLTRQGFYRHLRRARIVPSFATEENFGYAVVEGMAQGALPLLRDGASYPELVDGELEYLFDDVDDFAEHASRMLAGALTARRDPVTLARRFDLAEHRMMADMAAMSRWVRTA